MSIQGKITGKWYNANIIEDKVGSKRGYTKKED